MAKNFEEKHLEKLESLERLKNRGTISSDKFDKEKAKLDKDLAVYNSPAVKKISGIIVGSCIALFIVAIGVSLVPPSNELAEAVSQKLDSLKQEGLTDLANTSYGGYQGDVVNVEPAGRDGVKVNISTHFTDPSDNEDGGKRIARNIYAMLCLDIPELNSLYVSSTSSGLDSSSVYRSDVPACR